MEKTKKFDFNIIFIILTFAVGLGCFIVNNNFGSGMAFVFAVVLFIVGLLLLIKGGDWFVDGATSIAEKFGIPEVIIGATVVSIGTTLPEVMVSAQAALKDNGAMSYGNAIGSIICNVSLIAAITLAVKPGKTDKKSLRLPVIFFFVAAAIYAGVAYLLGDFTRTIGIILLAIFAVYMIISVILAFKDNKKGATEEAVEDEEKEVPLPIWQAILFLILGAAIIAFGATLLVDNGTIIAHTIGVPDTVIALTFVALGTSLPELVTAITSLAKGHGALSLGNVIGANLFNLVLVSGIAITLKPFALPCDKIFMNTGLNASLVLDIPLMIAVMLILTVPALFKGKLYRWQGILLLCMYAAFCAFQFIF